MDLGDILAVLPPCGLDFCAEINCVLIDLGYPQRAIKGDLIYLCDEQYNYMPAIMIIGKNYPIEARCQTAEEYKQRDYGKVWLVRQRADWVRVLRSLLE